MTAAAGSRRVCLPPLDGDFFTQLQRVGKPLHQGTINDVISSAVGLFGANFRVTLETMFTTVEQLAAMSGMRPSGGKQERRRFQRMRTCLLQALAGVLEESLTEHAEATTGSSSPASGTGYALRTCRFHQKIVESLAYSDSVISLNYDCLVDVALRDHGHGRWNARYGYCLPMQPVGEGAWNPDPPASRGRSISLFKLHGSLHFGKHRRNVLRLKARPYSHMKKNQVLQFEIIPPESQKRLTDPTFRHIWSGAGTALQKTRTLVFIGYSFPPGDVHTAAFFRLRGTGRAAPKLRNLVVVNPDREARHRTVDIMRASMDRKTRVLVFDTLEEFSYVPRALWDSGRPK
ncbi:MAG TPA: SIR2 family protein [Candidatus Eisenbacteria bacterium]|nr:SIR2 family protein [Candidatus Eisenbacteria bacterium]